MSCLAIKGHVTRGKEVIEILEMLGGVNTHNLYGDENYTYYTIDSDKEIKGGIYVFGDEELSSFTLEEFLEKYPYKVGDKVYNIVRNENQTITKLAWQENEVIYQTNNNEYVYVNYLQPYKKETMEDKKTLIQIDLTKELCVADEVEVVLGDYEFVLKDGKTYFIKKKPKYPKTYEECCDVLKIPNDERYIYIDVPLGYNKLLYSFTELLICCDAYWKIAGEQMGLGKPWEPTIQDTIWGITRSKDEIEKYSYRYGKTKLLEFPTEEMRDEFYENFKDLIEACKELL